MSNVITIEVWDATGNKKQQVEVPADAPVNRLVAVLVDRMNLPRFSPDGQLMSYKFHHKASGRQLLEDQTLESAGVREKDVLRLQPEITAGAGDEVDDGRPRRPCPACGEKILVVAKKCPYCKEFFDETLRRESEGSSPADGPERFIVPVGVDPLAMAAGYVGLCAVLPLIHLGALMLGIRALQELRAHPEKLGKGRAIFAIAMGSIFTLLYGFVMIVASFNKF